jgi:hypothetical protein
VGTLTDVVRAAWGGWIYTYEGSYQWGGGPGEHSELPHKGAFRSALTVSYTEQRLVDADFALAERE